MSHPDRNASRVLAVFGLYGDIDWARLDVGGSVSEPTIPFVVWRFKPGPCSDALSESLRTLIGRRDWRLERGGRNWVLWPKALAEEFATGRWRTDTDAALHLARSDRGLAELLVEEFWQVIASLEGDVGRGD